MSWCIVAAILLVVSAGFFYDMIDRIFKKHGEASVRLLFFTLDTRIFWKRWLCKFIKFYAWWNNWKLI